MSGDGDGCSVDTVVVGVGVVAVVEGCMSDCWGDSDDSLMVEMAYDANNMVTCLGRG